jgi:hypothetical protein
VKARVSEKESFQYDPEHRGREEEEKQDPPSKDHQDGLWFTDGKNVSQKLDAGPGEEHREKECRDKDFTDNRIYSRKRFNMVEISIDTKPIQDFKK